jgi:energy-coupling factor transporter ATP-binding protein EcfA2
MNLPDSCFVIGIEGEWGSGKSSFINLVSEHLKSLCGKPENEDGLKKSSICSRIFQRHRKVQKSSLEIIHFTPWIVGTRDGLLKELFAGVVKAAINIKVKEGTEKEGSIGWIGKIFRKICPTRYSEQAIYEKNIRSFFSEYSALMPLVKWGSLLASAAYPPALVIPQLLGAIEHQCDKGISLDDENKKIREELKRMEGKIVVFIDDLDRLEPNEIVEVFRLMRAVLDFPNIVYVLCYSRKIIAQSLSIALQFPKDQFLPANTRTGVAMHVEDLKVPQKPLLVEDRYLAGNRFLEKIVQTSFSIPRPEPSCLERMLIGKLKQLYPELPKQLEQPELRELRELSREKDGADDVESALQVYPDISIHRRYLELQNLMRTLTTPRHVVRMVNVLLIYAIQILEKTNGVDMIWLQFIRSRSPELYAWIENYMIEFSRFYNENSDPLPEPIDVEDFKAIIEQRDRLLMKLYPNNSEHETNSERETCRKSLELFLPISTSHFVDKGVGDPRAFRFYFALAKWQRDE